MSRTFHVVIWPLVVWLGVSCPAAEPVVAVRPVVALTAEEVEVKYRELLSQDDEAQAEVDAWIEDAYSPEKEEEEFQKLEVTLELRIRDRLRPVQAAYEEFLKLHPEHVNARIAYASFLDEIGEETAGGQQLVRVLELDPVNTAAMNNLANHYGHTGQIKKAFDLWEKSIQLQPEIARYHHNLGTSVFLFRRDAMQHYGLNEQEVFTKALEHYHQALRLEPDNFLLASDVAQTHYGVKPVRIQEALKDWEYALKLARDDIERQGIYLHFARFKIMERKWDESVDWLKKVRHPMYDVLKGRIYRNMEFRRDLAERGLDPDNPPVEEQVPVPQEVL